MKLVDAGGAMLLDDVHHTPRHSRDSADSRSSRLGHRQADRGGHYEEVRPRGQIPDWWSQLLAAHQTQSMGALRRTLLFSLRQGEYVGLLCECVCVWGGVHFTLLILYLCPDSVFVTLFLLSLQCVCAHRRSQDFFMGVHFSSPKKLTTFF